jgi:hypothetical protein
MQVSTYMTLEFVTLTFDILSLGSGLHRFLAGQLTNFFDVSR